MSGTLVFVTVVGVVGGRDGYMYGACLTSRVLAFKRRSSCYDQLAESVAAGLI